MDIQNLVNSENNVAVHQVLVIAKQDIALDNSIKGLNELCHINRIEFEDFGQKYGVTSELLNEVRDLKEKLIKAKYGRF
jgi:hypothetical protein